MTLGGKSPNTIKAPLKSKSSSTLLERVPEVNYGHPIDFAVGGFRGVLYPPHAFRSTSGNYGFLSLPFSPAQILALGGGSGVNVRMPNFIAADTPIRGFRSFVGSKGFNLRKVRHMTPSCFFVLIQWTRKPIVFCHAGFRGLVHLVTLCVVSMDELPPFCSHDIQRAVNMSGS